LRDLTFENRGMSRTSSKVNPKRGFENLLT
jgi:hypothetical protein